MPTHAGTDGDLVRGGRVVLESEILTADVVIQGGTVAALESPGRATVADTVEIDASGAYVMPGGVDVHTHVGLAFGDESTRDDFESASRAAAMGGTTTFLEFSIPGKDERPLDALNRRLRASRDVTHVDYGFHGCITRTDGEHRDDIVAMAKRGVTSIKVFTAYRDLVMLELGEIREVMEAAAEAGCLVMVHAETESLVESSLRHLSSRGLLQPRYHSQSRPPEAELDAATSVLSLAGSTGCAVYLVHVTLPRVVDAIVQARASGVDAFGESCPHYLLLDESCYTSDRPELFVCSPPMRAPEIPRELWARASELSGIHSDHCCFDSAQKAKGVDDLTRIPPGLPGIETRLPVVISEALNNRMELTDVVRLCAAEPARLFGLSGKGSLLPGYDGDLVIVDPKAHTEVREGLHMTTDFSPFDGRTLKGRISMVVARGRTLLQDDRWMDLPPEGRFLARTRRASRVGPRQASSQTM